MLFKIVRVILPLSLLLGAVLACNFSTANISDIKIAKDNDGKETISKVGPGDKFFVVTTVNNNPGKVKVKFKLVYDDAKGQKSGDPVTAFDGGKEQTLDVDGSRVVYYELTMPSSGMPNGKYRAEVRMLNDKDEEKEKKTATFEVAGFTEGGE